MNPNPSDPSNVEPGPMTCDPAQLRVVVSGSVTRRVLHAAGHLSEAGSRLLMALAEQSVRNGCAYLRLDLGDVTVIDIGCLRSLRQFQAMLHSIGVTLRFTDPHRRTAVMGLTTFVAGAAMPV